MKLDVGRRNQAARVGSGRAPDCSAPPVPRPAAAGTPRARASDPPRTRGHSQDPGAGRSAASRRRQPPRCPLSSVLRGARPLLPDGQTQARTSLLQPSCRGLSARRWLNAGTERRHGWMEKPRKRSTRSPRSVRFRPGPAAAVPLSLSPSPCSLDAADGPRPAPPRTSPTWTPRVRQQQGRA